MHACLHSFIHSTSVFFILFLAPEYWLILVPFHFHVAEQQEEEKKKKMPWKNGKTSLLASHLMCSWYKMNIQGITWRLSVSFSGYHGTRNISYTFFSSIKYTQHSKRMGTTHHEQTINRLSVRILRASSAFPCNLYLHGISSSKSAVCVHNTLLCLCVHKWIGIKHLAGKHGTAAQCFFLFRREKASHP